MNIIFHHIKTYFSKLILNYANIVKTINQKFYNDLTYVPIKDYFVTRIECVPNKNINESYKTEMNWLTHRPASFSNVLLAKYFKEPISSTSDLKIVYSRLPHSSVKQINTRIPLEA